MTEVSSAPAEDDAEQLLLDFEIPEEGTADVVVPVDVMVEVLRSPAYQELVEMRDAAYANNRSGARTIARAAFAALQGDGLTKEEYAALFTVDDMSGPAPLAFEDYSTERPPREFDHAERAAGEAVRHPWNDD